MWFPSAGAHNTTTGGPVPIEQRNVSRLAYDGQQIPEGRRGVPDVLSALAERIRSLEYTTRNTQLDVSKLRQHSLNELQKRECDCKVLMDKNAMLVYELEKTNARHEELRARFNELVEMVTDIWNHPLMPGGQERIEAAKSHVEIKGQDVDVYFAYFWADFCPGWNCLDRVEPLSGQPAAGAQSAAHQGGGKAGRRALPHSA